MSPRKSTYVGFGYDPKETVNHFYVVIPKKLSEPVVVYERFQWQEDGEQNVNIPPDKRRLEISRHKWNLIVPDVTKAFNTRLKEQKIPVGKFCTGGTAIDRLLGKELMVLLWAIEDIEPSQIPKAITNWRGFQPEERWWLYTMTNACTGEPLDHDTGWRVALRWIMAGNPTVEREGNREQYVMEQFKNA